MSIDENNSTRIDVKDAAILGFTKHLATLASAGMALVCAVVSRPNTGKLFPVLSIACLTTSLLSSVAASGISLQLFQGKAAEKRPDRYDAPAVCFVVCLMLAGLALAGGLALIAVASYEST